MIISLKKIILTSVFIQQSFGFWIINIDKRPSHYLNDYGVRINGAYDLPLLYNYEKKDTPWESSGGCSILSLTGPRVNQDTGLCYPGYADTDPKARCLFKTIDDNSNLITKIEFDSSLSKDMDRPCGMVYDNYNFTTYVCGTEVNDQYAKLSTKIYNQNQNVKDQSSDIWLVTLDDQVSQYGYKNQLVMDYFRFEDTTESISDSRCLTSMDLPNDKLFDQLENNNGITCDNQLYDPLIVKGVGNVLSSLENKSTKESYPCFFVGYKLRFSIYACGKHVPVLNSETIIPSATSTVITTTITTTSTIKSSSSVKPTSTIAPTCKTGYCGKKAGNGPTGACCSSSDDCLDTCNSNGKCGVSDETGEPKKATCPA